MKGSGLTHNRWGLERKAWGSNPQRREPHLGSNEAPHQFGCLPERSERESNPHSLSTITGFGPDKHTYASLQVAATPLDALGTPGAYRAVVLIRLQDTGRRATPPVAEGEGLEPPDLSAYGLATRCITTLPTFRVDPGGGPPIGTGHGQDPRGWGQGWLPETRGTELPMPVSQVPRAVRRLEPYYARRRAAS